MTTTITTTTTLTRTKCAISFTGGKDSTLALHDVWTQADQYEVVALVTFVPANMKRFRAHPVHVVEVQAQAMGLNYLKMEVGGPDFLASYRDNMLRLRREWGVEILVTGDILPVCGDFMERAVQDTGISLHRPLWGLPRPSFLLKPEYTILISCVNTTKFSPGFPASSLVGQPFNRATLDRIREHNDARAAVAEAEVDLAGEFGEFHTMVVDAPAFRNGRVDVVAGKVVEEGEYAFFEFEEVRLVAREGESHDQNKA
ncbi:hypothetical protein BC936DRAFT_139727 [Jimgerdemannia flammicorona]|uniref:Diphthine--ammonia ligase n=1 Tax=Jimgerdemannia flammicorona TaxID=994334 RepID=A0A433B9C7_9FUNG|nr:hypothetical protein BC936DRAFT_139727 [Jimgerdemannia flammicorona]